MTIDYEELTFFQKEFKRLTKKYPSLPEDFKLAKRAAIELFHLLKIDNQAVFEIPNLPGTVPVYKLKKFACKSLKGKGAKSGIRIIYSFNRDLQKIVFIEIYFKGEKKNEDRVRIKKYLKELEKK